MASILHCALMLLFLFLAVFFALNPANQQKLFQTSLVLIKFFRSRFITTILGQRKVQIKTV